MKDLGMGIAWAGFWIMLGLANFGEHTITKNIVIVDRNVTSFTLEGLYKTWREKGD